MFIISLFYVMLYNVRRYADAYILEEKLIMGNFHTTADVFFVIILVYLGITLALGAKQLYFGNFIEEEKAEKIDVETDNPAKS